MIDHYLWTKLCYSTDYDFEDEWKTTMSIAQSHQNDDFLGLELTGSIYFMLSEKPKIMYVS